MATIALVDDDRNILTSVAMVLEGEIFYQQNGNRYPFRGVWTPNVDGSVTQHFTQYDSENDTWNDWFVGRYVRQNADQGTPSGE